MEDKIRRDIETYDGIKILNISRVKGGWLNQLWKISTDHGDDQLVKVYSPERYDHEKLHFLESALYRQILIEKQGIPCPHIVLRDGHAIRYLDNQIAYIMMGFCSGHNESCSTITAKQMYSLGMNCALMHKAFSMLPYTSVKGYPFNSQKLLYSLWENHHKRKQNIHPTQPIRYREAILMQKSILESIDKDLFERIPKGIAHEDFTPDNLLFHDTGLSAIIDFDRNHYSFLWHDIGRTILSFALRDGVLDMQKVAAFVRGYSLYFPLTRANIADSLRISWCIESTWWIQPAYFLMEPCKATRYRDEIIWLGKHWFEIDSILQDSFLII
ncbi:MAG TPA: phosphotransferase [Candidatus Gallacutalibacter pullistercoris]|nr:phosphotransferase [Candidatus Gallacutalibacter pullistercoris]